MKKKIIALCLVLALAATAIAGATLAYFTDTDSADNVFTAGSVRIELVEQEREYNDDGTLKGLKAFTENKELVPVVGSAQGEKDKYGLPVAKNYVDKIVNVKNTGVSSAYVRVIVAMPAALEEDDPGKSAANVLHWNEGNKFTAVGDYDTTADPQPENANWANVSCSWKGTGASVPTAVIDGVTYNLYTFTYEKPLAPGATTDAAAIVGFYLDKAVDCKYVKQDNGTEKLVYTFTKDGVTRDIGYDLSNGVKIPVFAQAVQAVGFDSAADAFAAAALPSNPWATTTP